MQKRVGTRHQGTHTAESDKQAQFPSHWRKNCKTYGHSWGLVYRPFEGAYSFKDMHALNFQPCVRCSEIKWVD